MGERLTEYFPFIIAVVLPPAGLMLALIERQQGDRDKAIRLLVMSLIAAVIWALLFLL